MKVRLHVVSIYRHATGQKNTAINHIIKPNNDLPVLSITSANWMQQKSANLKKRDLANLKHPFLYRSKKLYKGNEINFFPPSFRLFTLKSWE